jgi:hypothetical protein
VGTQLQIALTKEVELVKYGELVAELAKLHQHDRRRESHRAVFQSSASASVWVGHGVAYAMAYANQRAVMSNIQLAVHAAWYIHTCMGVQVGLLQPMIGRKLRKAGADRGTVDGHGVGITGSNLDGALRTCHSRVQHCIAREARRAGVHVMAEVLGAFTRALWDADLEKCEEYLRRHPARQRQGIVPDLQIGTALCAV